MKPIELDLMLKYRYLSSLNSYKGLLLYIDTLADKKNNDYTQRLHFFDPTTLKDEVALEDKRIRYQVMDNQIIILKGNSSEFIETDVYAFDGELNKLFTLPLAVSSITSVNEQYYFLQAGISLDCPDYFKADEETKRAYHKQVEENQDYVILNEYPFFFNGAGFINGTRTNGFIVDKNTHEVKRVTPVTMDVESTLVSGGKVYFMANDYESMKEMFSSVYCYDCQKGELTCLYHNEKLFLRRLVEVKGEVLVMGAERTCVSSQNFYKINEDGLTCVYQSDYMFHNSIGTDCHYGRGRNSLNVNGDLYITNVVDERAVLNKFDGEKLEFITNFEGSCDDFAFIGDDLYITAMKDMKLQEIYKVEGDNVIQLTKINEDVLKDHYVAKPERISCFNEDEIRGWVLKPIDFDPNKKYPMILDIHGGPKTAYGEVFYHEMQLWAGKGYFVIFCNPHCSDGRGDAFADYLKHYGATDYYDIMKFVDKALEVYPQIDPERLGVTGGSYGGYMTNWIITHTDRFKAAASQRSISNRVADFYYSDYSFDTTYENGIPLDEKAIELFWNRSPLKYVNNAVTPTLFIQSTEDYRCPFPEAVQLFAALKWKGVETKVCGFKGENHELSRSGKPTHRLRRLKEITDWMESHLK